MKRYRVLWFDDEWQELGHIIEKAGLENIDLESVDNSIDGIATLKKELEKFDAVIVDGLFHKSKGSQSELTDAALNEVGMFLLKESKRKEIPWFILSGQKRIDWSKNSNALVFKKGKVYDKLEESDLQDLWSDLKLAANNQLDTQTRQHFSPVFDALLNLRPSSESEYHLLSILKSIVSGEVKIDETLYFTQLRIILEHLFRVANRLGLLHDKCIEQGKVNLTDSSLFMAGKETKYSGVKNAKPHFNYLIADSVANLLFVTGAASHTVEADQTKNINLQEYRKAIHSPYLLYALTFNLMDVIIWFDGFIQSNPDINKNKALWQVIPTSIASLHNGIIQQDLKGNYFCGSYFLAKAVVESRYSIGDAIRIIEEKENISFTKSTYPRFASKFEKDI